MIYFEKDGFSCSLYKVDKLEGHFFGWNTNELEGWFGSEFTLYPNTEEFVQAFLAPSILDRW